MFFHSRMFFQGAVATAMCVASAASASTSTATYVGSNGIEGLGSFSALVTYAYASGSTASLTISLTNTTSAATGGYVTALALTGAEGVSALSFVSSTDVDFAALSGPVSANPFGDFMSGTSTSSSWTGGGSPTVGVGTGQTAEFNFVLTGTAGALAGLDATTVLAPENDLGFAVRFRGMNNGGSDKVLGYTIPGPGALALMALAGVVTSRRRR